MRAARKWMCVFEIALELMASVLCHHARRRSIGVCLGGGVSSIYFLAATDGDALRFVGHLDDQFPGVSGRSR